jgi:hypothetical protein
MMRRTIEVETSQFSTNPTKRWVGQDYLVEDVTFEYPDELDTLDDEELLEMADNEENGVCYIDPQPVPPWTPAAWQAGDCDDVPTPRVSDEQDQRNSKPFPY